MVVHSWKIVKWLNWRSVPTIMDSIETDSNSTETSSSLGDFSTPHDKHHFGWTVFDHVISALVITPLAVAYWWSTWDLMGIYILPQNRSLSASICLAAGLTINGGIYCAQHWLLIKAKQSGCLLWLTWHHVHTYVFSIGTIFLWRGLWVILDVYTGRGPFSFLSQFFLSFIILVLLRCFTAAKSCPFKICNDLRCEAFKCSTKFSCQVSPYLECNKYLLLWKSFRVVDHLNMLVSMVWSSCESSS
jgi:hypothetical protein